MLLYFYVIWETWKLLQFVLERFEHERVIKQRPFRWFVWNDVRNIVVPLAFHAQYSVGISLITHVRKLSA